ncbi:MAG: TonB-dependent receptor, partial [Bryobacteraceae bacterium]
GTIQYVLSRRENDVDGDSELPPDSADLRNEWARAGFDVRHRLRLLGSWDLPGGLTLGSIFRAQSGSPYEWTTGLDVNHDGRAAERPAGVRRNALEAPGSATLDVRLSRRFQTRHGDEDSPEITLSADAFNALNRANYTRLIGNQSSPFFGLPVAATPARRLQIGLALEF